MLLNCTSAVYGVCWLRRWGFICISSFWNISETIIERLNNWTLSSPPLHEHVVNSVVFFVIDVRIQRLYDVNSNNCTLSPYNFENCIDSINLLSCNESTLCLYPQEDQTVPLGVSQRRPLSHVLYSVIGIINNVFVIFIELLKQHNNIDNTCSSFNRWLLPKCD